jgi:uncharacterized membrane protein (DUF485 family)
MKRSCGAELLKSSLEIFFKKFKRKIKGKYQNMSCPILNYIRKAVWYVSWSLLISYYLQRLASLLQARALTRLLAFGFLV